MNDRLTRGQMVALRILCGNGEQGVWAASQLIGREITALSEATRNEWQQIRDAAYPHWVEEDWTVRAAFSAKIRTLQARWQEAQGQLRLF